MKAFLIILLNLSFNCAVWDRGYLFDDPKKVTKTITCEENSIIFNPLDVDTTYFNSALDTLFVVTKDSTLILPLITCGVNE